MMMMKMGEEDDADVVYTLYTYIDGWKLCLYIRTLIKIYMHQGKYINIFVVQECLIGKLQILEYTISIEKDFSPFF